MYQFEVSPRRQGGGRNLHACCQHQPSALRVLNPIAEIPDWEKRSTTVVEIVPLAEKHKVILAMENHKDRTADEFCGVVEAPIL